MAYAIEIQKLVKTYKSRSRNINVVDGVDLVVEPGEIFGFLGPNGAGKTTTIKILLSIISQTSGKAFVFGKEPEDLNTRRLLSYLPEKPYYYEHMTGIEILRYYASLFGIKDEEKCKYLLEKVNLANDGDKTISQYSKGMQQRIGLAQSLLNDPKLLFLDEPTAGLDPIAHIEIRDLILQFREEGKTVFISSHELSDVERICDRVAIINRGRIAAQGRLENLLAGGRIEISAVDVPEAFGKGLSMPDSLVSWKSGHLIVDMPDRDTPNALLAGILDAGGKVERVVPRRKRLEDIFLETVKTHTSQQQAEKLN